LNLTADDVLPFWTVCDALSEALQPYDVVFFPDGELRSDTITADDLSRYSTVVLPHCHQLTEPQGEVLLGYLDDGGRMVAFGPIGTNLTGGLGAKLESHSGTVRAETTGPDTVGAGQITASRKVDAAVHLHRTDGGVALHLIRYDYDQERDSVPVLDGLTVEVDLDDEYDEVSAFGAGSAPRATLEREGARHKLKLEEVPLYSIFELHEPKGR
jgi:hypothetical protein